MYTIMYNVNMKQGDMIQLPFLLLRILNENSDEMHILSMPDIQGELELLGFPADRRSVYKAIDILKENNYDIQYKQISRKQGYYLKSSFKKEEIYYLLAMLNDTTSLSKKETLKLQNKLLSTLTYLEQDSLDIPKQTQRKTDNPTVLENIHVLLEAIEKNYFVQFKYFDLSVAKEKKYRRNKQKYILLPYALIYEEGKMYCVLYSPHYQSFSNYRLDKMELVELYEKNTIENIHFDLEAHLQNSLRMYSGLPDTITLVCKSQLANTIFDQFGKDIIISKVTNESFTAHIKTTITPTLIGFLLQFYKDITIVKPKELINEFNNIATYIHKTYGR